MMVLVDSSVLLDIFTEDPVWFQWSSAQIIHYGTQDVLAINPVIYAEVGARFDTEAELAGKLNKFQRLPLPFAAAFLAAKVFRRYRPAGGDRTVPLPDFFIGAHAQVDHLTLLTRNGQDFRNRFPGLTLICPDP